MISDLNMFADDTAIISIVAVAYERQVVGMIGRVLREGRR